VLSRLKWVLPSLLVFVAGQPVHCDGVVPRLRVGLLTHTESVPFSGANGLSVGCLPGEQVVCSVPVGETWEAQISQAGLKLIRADGSEAATVHSVICLAPPEGGTVTIQGIYGHWDERTDRDYRGVIEIRHDNAGRLSVINVVDVETYLRGVVSSEMPATYPLAALQAQAVAARGQALMKAGRHAKEGFDLCATQHCQVYGGATSEALRSDEAVVSTRGQFLVYNGRLADTLYASTCGGHTANSEDYWPQMAPVPYLRAQPDFEPDDNVEYTFPLSETQLELYLKYAPRVNCNQPRYAKSDKIRWWMVVPREEMEQKLRETVGDFGELLNIRVTDRADSGMVRKLVVIGTRKLVPVVGGEEVRKALAGLQSASFAIKSYQGPDEMPVVFVIWGAGWGHQVGMCQVGAAGLAHKGWDYEQILSKYYRGCNLERRY